MQHLLKARLFVTALLVIAMWPATAASASTISNNTLESQVQDGTNAERTARGIHTVKWQSCVDSYAESHARWMAAHRSLVHQSLSPIVRNCHLSAAGENIARGFTSGRSVMNAWMASPVHRANILRSRYRLLGVGVYHDKYGQKWISQVFGTYA